MSARHVHPPVCLYINILSAGAKWITLNDGMLGFKYVEVVHDRRRDRCGAREWRKIDRFLVLTVCSSSENTLCFNLLESSCLSHDFMKIAYKKFELITCFQSPVLLSKILLNTYSYLIGDDSTIYPASPQNTNMSVWIPVFRGLYPVVIMGLNRELNTKTLLN